MPCHSGFQHETITPFSQNPSFQYSKIPSFQLGRSPLSSPFALLDNLVPFILIRLTKQFVDLFFQLDHLYFPSNRQLKRPGKARLLRRMCLSAVERPAADQEGTGGLPGRTHPGDEIAASPCAVVQAGPQKGSPHGHVALRGLGPRLV